MKQQVDELFDPRVADWLEDGPQQVPPIVLRTLGGALPSIPQRHSWRSFRRSNLVPIPKLALAAGAALVLLLVVGAAGLLTNRGPIFDGTTATPSPARTASPQPSLTAFPATPRPTGTPTPTPTPVPPSSTPLAVATPIALTSADVGRLLQPGTYLDDHFIAPVAFTVPTGWKVTDIGGWSLDLQDATDGKVNVNLIVVGGTYPDPCSRRPSSNAVGPGVDDLVAAFSSMPNFTVADVTDVTIGGASGKSFTISNSIDTAQCTGGQIVLGTYAGGAGGSRAIKMFGGETDHFWVVDAGGKTVLIAITATPAILDATQPVFDSLNFEAASSN